MGNMKSFHGHQGSLLGDAANLNNINHSFQNIDKSEQQQRYLLPPGSGQGKGHQRMALPLDSQPDEPAAKLGYTSFSNVYVGKALAASQQRYRDTDPG